MLFNNKFSKRNKAVYKMKYINTKDNEFNETFEYEHERIENKDFIKGNRKLKI